MKLIVAIFRPEYLESIKPALASHGIHDCTVIPVLDKESHGITAHSSYPEIILQRESGIRKTQLPRFPADTMNREPHEPEPDSDEKFSRKIMILLIIADEMVHPVVQALIHIHEAERHGEGKIIVCPMTAALPIKTAEPANNAPV